MGSPLQALIDYRLSQSPPISKAEMARRLKVARITITRWENGDQPPDVEMLPRIEQETGIPARVLRPDLVEKHAEIFGSAA